jgi:murein DD-endopeptidase MepM/ murein hydrolase activator NlpD
MEKTMSVEDKIRRAEEIYNRRRENSVKYNTARVNVNSKKDFKLFRKMIWQIIICLLIYFAFYFTTTNNYVFSEDLRNKANEILSYDMNFEEIYSTIINTYNSLFTFKEVQSDNEENITKDNETEENNKIENEAEVNNVDLKEETTNAEENIGGAVEESNAEKVEETVSLTQEEQEGYVSSKFGIRNPTTDTVPKNHTGVDIAAVTGTIIKSATDGVVSLASSEGDYGNHLKITNGDVTMVYAHCNTLYVNQGDNITQGQNIAEVGSTGNSTGPHLHFEIRKSDRFIDPQKIINI